MVEHVVDNAIMLVDTSTKYPRVLVSTEMKNSIMNMTHSVSHPGIRGTRQLISRLYVWGGMMKDIKEYVAACEKCNTIKTTQHLRPPHSTLPPPARHFTTCHCDIVGPFPTTSTRKRYILTMIDRFSRWLEAVPISNINADTITECFINHWISRFGIPADLITDRSLQFTSCLFTSTMEALGTQVHFTTAYHPKSNGMVERQHQ